MSAPPSSTSDELNSDAKLKNSVPIADEETDDRSAGKSRDQQ